MQPDPRLAVVAVVAALGALGSCAGAPPRCEIAPRDPAAAPLLWRVQRAGGPAVWLFGTIHDAGAGEVPPAAWAALDRSPAFVSELGDDDADPRQLAELARLPWGQVLDQLLPADDWWELVTAMAGAMSEDELRHARPWFAMIRLRSHVVRSPRPSMDFALAEHARERGISVAGLETWAQQVAAIAASITAPDLSAAIHGRHTAACELARLRTAYGGGDLVELTRMLVIPGRGSERRSKGNGNERTERSPGRHAGGAVGPEQRSEGRSEGNEGNELLDQRNQRWLPRIEPHFERGAFIAVGLGHLIGDGGLLATFERAGYRVERAPGQRAAPSRPLSAE